MRFSGAMGMDNTGAERRLIFKDSRFEEGFSEN
jgi:hypothetical protein